jgi:hypothetical protein
MVVGNKVIKNRGDTIIIVLVNELLTIENLHGT